GYIHAQDLSGRLILKDGSYQLATKWEVKGDRVRYLSSERNEWEEVPNSLVDWAATEKYEKDRAAGVPSPEAIELDKEVAAERAAEEARSPLVAPGLHLPEDGSIVLLDTYQSQPELVELQQNGGELNRNRKANVLHAAINPIASSKQTIELDGPHAPVQAHTNVPSIYVNLEQGQDGGANGGFSEQPQQPRQPQPPQQPWDRFHIVRAKTKNGKRIVGNIKISMIGKVSQEQSLVPTTSQQLTGGWVKITPNAALEPGEYAVVELLGKEGMNTFVWDFGVNPSAGANSAALKPESSASGKTK
ncbi:MAG: hypothetical protein JOZ80_14540, partial [Acidobacteriaceae bacterium]|nr:hypothetical protein [Acidobacteriaceae bacterium]